MEGEASEVVTNHRKTKAFSEAVKAGYAKKLASGWTNPRKRPLTSTVPFDTRITFNCTTAERSHWQQVASGMGMTLTAYLRMALMELDNADLE